HYELVLTKMDEKLAGLRIAWQSAAKNQEEAEKSVAELEQALKTSRREKETLLRRITADTEASASLARMQEELAMADSQAAGLENNLAALGEVEYDREAHQKARAQLAELEALQRRADMLEERASRRGQVAADIERTEKMAADLTAMEEGERTVQAGLGYEESAYREADAAAKAATSALFAAKASHAKARELAVRSLTVEENLQTQKAEQQKKRQEIRETEEEIRYLDALDLYLRKFRVELAGRIRPLLARRASELLSLTTSGRYTRLELDEDYQISLYDGNHAFPLGRFSGGEQDLANLCLRVAISQILAERSGGAPINFIVLDEIFGSQDEERKSLILNALGQLSSQFRQIFMITHVESLKDTLPVILEVGLVDEQQSEIRML
ncbi:MAG TPA: SbcC/MukB-like Walker B domain-containing protein, partial [bacterium]|nr:SbcC/MukB-like Walker B domain-containing protein [bacterium]